MPKSLSEIRASKRTGLPERTYELCLSQSLVAEAQELQEEKASLAFDATRKTENGEGPPRKMAEKQPARLAEIDERLDELLEEMAEHTGTLRLRARDGGAWQRWVDDHPAREINRDAKGNPTYHPTDESAAYGLANANDLLADLGSYAVAWNDDEMVEGDWETIAKNAAPGDLAELCRIVVQMHAVTGYRPGKSRWRSSETTPDDNASASPSN